MSLFCTVGVWWIARKLVSQSVSYTVIQLLTDLVHY